MKFIFAVILAFLPTLAYAQQHDAFEALVSERAPACVPMAVIKQIADKVESLDGNQFQFVRGLYSAIPPISADLPMGDAAWEATSAGRFMLGLSGDIRGSNGGVVNASCARFIAPKPIIDMVIEVGKSSLGGKAL